MKNPFSFPPNDIDPQVHSKEMERRLEAIRRRYRSKAGRLKGAACEVEVQLNLFRLLGPPDPGSDEEKACDLLRAFILEQQEEQ